MSNRKKWTDLDIEFLKQNHFKMTVPDIARHLGITVSAVTNKLKRLKLSYASSPDRLDKVSVPDEKPAKPVSEGKTSQKSSKTRQASNIMLDTRTKADIAHRVKAIELYENAIRKFHQIDKQKPLEPQRKAVKDLFLEIFTSFSSEIDICCKAKSYYNYLSDLEKPDSTARDIESKITEGIIYLQIGSPKEALRVFRAIAKTEPHNSYNLYCLACAYAKENDAKNAIKSLKDAVKFDPTLKFIAENDKDLINLYENQEFSKILGTKF